MTPEQVDTTTMSQTNTVTGNNITVAGVEYAPTTTGNRAIVVVDRGWIFAGDVAEKDGRILLTRAVWLFRWESIGFAAVIEAPAKADIRKIADVDVPAGAEIFRVPVCDNWGLDNG